LLTTFTFITGYSVAKSNSFNIIVNNQNNKETNNDTIIENSTQEFKQEEQTKNLSNTTNNKENNANSSSKKTNISFQNTHKEIEKLVYLDVYYQDGCSYCTKLFKFLNSLNDSIKSKIIITKHNVSNNYQQLIDPVKKLDVDKQPGTPYVVFNNQKTIF